MRIVMTATNQTGKTVNETYVATFYAEASERVLWEVFVELFVLSEDLDTEGTSDFADGVDAWTGGVAVDGFSFARLSDMAVVDFSSARLSDSFNFFSAVVSARIRFSC